MTSAISLIGLNKRFDDVTAVDNVDLEVGDGEFLTLLGPSGSGKTTVLRMIAGFEIPTRGSVLLNGMDVTEVPAFKRDVNTVFQDYALFPHMSVRENVEYGLRVKGVPSEVRSARASEALEGVRLTGFDSRLPSQLSGGQRQRVALARALVNRPRVLLLDEPLGALDLKLREEMQVEIKSIQSALGITFIYVTHDQGEALSMSDRVAVFNEGRIEQIGTPREIYEQPASEFVARFVGITNLLKGDVGQRMIGRPNPSSLRPEHVDVLQSSATPPGGQVSISGTVSAVQYLGASSRVICTVDGGTSLIASGPSEQFARLNVGDNVTLTWNPDSVFQIRQQEQTRGNL